jgi:hypothetical protein
MENKICIKNGIKRYGESCALNNNCLYPKCLEATFLEFKQMWEKKVLPNKELFIRNGQSLMNFLGDVWLEEYKRISSQHFYDETNIDCFYNNNLIPNTLKHLEKAWKNYPN